MEKICISGPGGQGFTVQIKRKKFQMQSIFQLKQKIKRKSGIPANNQRLTHRQKELQSNKTFRSYGICPGSKIFLQDKRKASNRKTGIETRDMRYKDNDLLARNKQPNYTTSDRHIQQHKSPVPRETRPLHHHTERREHNSQDRSMNYTKSPSELYSEQRVQPRIPASNTHLHSMKNTNDSTTPQDSVYGYKYGNTNPFQYTPPIHYPNNTTHSQVEYPTDYENTYLQSTTAKIETRDMRYKDNDLLARNKQPNYTNSDRHIQQHKSPVPREISPLHHHTERREHNRSMNYTKNPPEQYSGQKVQPRMPASNTHLHSMKNKNHSTTPQDSEYRYKYGNTNPFQYTPPINASSNRQHIGNTRSNCNYPNNTTWSSDLEFQKRNKVNIFVPGKISSTHFYKELPKSMQYDRITPSITLMDQIQLNSGNIPVRITPPNKHDKQGSYSCCKCSIL